MKTEDVIKCIVDVLDDNSLVISIFGQVSDELYNSGDSAKYFYMRGGMGMASSIGMGIALARPEKKVFVLDGDGSLIMNIGSLASISHYKPANLYHVIINNRVHGSIGGYPTFASDTLNFKKVIEGFGIKSVFETSENDLLNNYIKSILKSNGPHEIIADTEFESSPGKGHATRMGYIKERFMKNIDEKNPNLPDV